MNIVRGPARWLVGLLAVALAGCGSTGSSVSSSPALAPVRQQFGDPQIQVKSIPRAPLQALREAVLSGSGAVPVIIFKSNALYVENVFKTQPTMDVCTTLLNDVVKRARSSENKGPASYYCVPVQNGEPGAPILVAQYDSLKGHVRSPPEYGSRRKWLSRNR